MNIILDACTAINLVNGDALGVAIGLPDCRFIIGPQSLDECGSAKPMLQGLIDAGSLLLQEDNELSSSLFLELLAQYSLGDGETETLTFSKMFGYTICTDDKKARHVANQMFGADRVTGSLGLLRRAVQQGMVTPNDAHAAYKKMISAGAFVPDIPLTFFNGSLGTA